MSFVKINEHASKEEKLNQILDHLEELKHAFSEIVDEFAAGDTEEEIVDLLTGALDAIEDAHDVVLDVTEELAE